MSKATTFKNSTQKPSIVIGVTLEESCACKEGGRPSALVSASSVPDLPHGHSCCDVTAMAAALLGEAQIVADSLIQLLVDAGLSDAQARKSVDDMVKRWLEHRRAKA